MPDDPISNDSTNPHFEQLLAAPSTPLATRRRLLQLGLGSAALPFLGLPLRAAANARRGLRFPLLAASNADRVRVPEGYRVQMLYAWGDPVSAGPAFRADAGNSAAEQAEQAGMHHDGMHFFPLHVDGRPSSTRGLLCVNHEYTDERLLHPDGAADWSHGKTLKSQNAHGVSVIEVELAAQADGPRWRRRAPVALRAAHHRPHADAHRRSGCRGGGDVHA
jgi:secreted PhoX family phosphatase